MRAWPSQHCFTKKEKEAGWQPESASHSTGSEETLVEKDDRVVEIFV
jgi:hypothetical protein